MTGPARILLVDDSVVVRGLLSRTIDAEPDLEVLSTAPNGRIGVEKVRSLEPDLVVLDIEMPEMNGLEALQEIRKSHPDLPVIMFSTLTGDGASVTVEALAKGASDYATKPTNTGNVMEAMSHVEAELISKIRTLVSARRPRRTPAPPVQRTTTRTGNAAGITAVVVGSSTGGPVALEEWGLLPDIFNGLRVDPAALGRLPAGGGAAGCDPLQQELLELVMVRLV